MREIKFRIWDKLIECMEKALVVYFNNNEVYFIHKGGSQKRKFEEVELMQFTGLLDKNDKEIYEGDIVKDIAHDNKADILIGEVKFKEGRWQIEALSLFNLMAVKDSIEIIGNIYENPNLLN